MPHITGCGRTLASPSLEMWVRISRWKRIGMGASVSSASRTALRSGRTEATGSTPSRSSPRSSTKNEDRQTSGCPSERSRNPPRRCVGVSSGLTSTRCLSPNTGSRSLIGRRPLAVRVLSPFGTSGHVDSSFDGCHHNCTTSSVTTRIRMTPSRVSLRCVGSGPCAVGGRDRCDHRHRTHHR